MIQRGQRNVKPRAATRPLTRPVERHDDHQLGHAPVASNEMPGRPKAHDRSRLASGRQLWRLNTLGRLALVEDAGRRISSAEASTLIAAAAASREFVPAIGTVDGEWGEAPPQRHNPDRDSARARVHPEHEG
jgi:hypothetical protein